MARPKIGVFGALVAVGGILAWRWAQRHRASQANLNRDLSRWEGEGGAMAGTTQMAPGMQVAPATAGPAAPNGQANGATLPGGSGDAWPFPHS